jgi:hypothetical protein
VALSVKLMMGGCSGAAKRFSLDALLDFVDMPNPGSWVLGYSQALKIGNQISQDIVVHSGHLDFLGYPWILQCQDLTIGTSAR